MIITGGAGFLGQLLIEHLLANDANQPIVVVDQIEARDQRAQSVVADLAADPHALAPLVADGPCTIFHLASVVSSGAEADWSAAVAVNLMGLVGLIEQCRASGHHHRVVFASSVAVFGGEFTGAPTGDRTKQTPTSTYGMTKAVGELLIDDASRKGFIDGRTARLPTVIVRPGAPNMAASSFCSGIFREPLQGMRCRVPVPGNTDVVVISPQMAVTNLATLAAMDAEALGHMRAVALPGLTVSVDQMVAALERVGGPKAVRLLDFEPDDTVTAIVAGWPGNWDDERGRALGLIGDDNIDAIVLAFSQTL